MALLEAAWLPNCAMKRIMCHWTGGQHRASDLDREHYHFLLEANGTVVRGNRSIVDNVSTADGIYAAHTLRCNTGSIDGSTRAIADSWARHFCGSGAVSV